MFTEKQVSALTAPLDGSCVKERAQGGAKLSYIEGWHAIAEANRIFGFDAWTRETVCTNLVSERERKIGRPPNTREGWGVTYVAKVRVTIGDVIREGVGAGHGIDADLGQAHESAIKEAETDAMKRALRTFGNPFGLALYDKTRANVDNGGGRDQKPQDEPRKPPEPIPAPEGFPEDLCNNDGTVSRVKVKDWGKGFVDDVWACTDDDQLTALVNTSKVVLDCIKEHIPAWYYGNDGEGNGLKNRIEQQREQIKKEQAA